MISKMWSAALLFLIIQINTAIEESNFVEFKQITNKHFISQNIDRVSNNTKLNSKEIEGKSSFVNLANDKTNLWNEEKKSTQVLKDEKFQDKGRGKKLSYKKSILHFFIKSVLIVKTFFTIIFPIAVIAAKILSWKAITFSLMAFLMAKILLVKNLMNGTNTFATNPTNLVPPVFIQSFPNDAQWKRQIDFLNQHKWTSP